MLFYDFMNILIPFCPIFGLKNYNMFFDKYS